MDKHRDYHTKWNKPHGEGQMSYDIIYMWNLKNKKMQVNLYRKQKPTGTEKKCMVTEGERWGRDKFGVWD